MRSGLHRTFAVGSEKEEYAGEILVGNKPQTKVADGGFKTKDPREDDRGAFGPKKHAKLAEDCLNQLVRTVSKTDKVEEEHHSCQSNATKEDIDEEEGEKEEEAHGDLHLNLLRSASNLGNSCIDNTTHSGRQPGD